MPVFSFKKYKIRDCGRQTAAAGDAWNDKLKEHSVLQFVPALSHPSLNITLDYGFIKYLIF